MTLQVEPQGICKLVSCADDELAVVANELKIPSSTAIGLRRIWQRKLAGKCCLCGTSTRGNLCGRCRSRSTGTTLDNRRPRTLLKQIPASTVLFHSVCACGKEIEIRAGYLLDQFKKYGTVVRKKTLCRQCVRTLVMKRRRPTPQATPVADKVVVIPPKKVEPLDLELRYQDLKTPHLMFRPFEELRTLSL